MTALIKFITNYPITAMLILVILILIPIIISSVALYNINDLETHVYDAETRIAAIEMKALKSVQVLNAGPTRQAPVSPTSIPYDTDVNNSFEKPAYISTLCEYIKNAGIGSHFPNRIKEYHFLMNELGDKKESFEDLKLGTTELIGVISTKSTKKMIDLKNVGALYKFSQIHVGSDMTCAVKYEQLLQYGTEQYGYTQFITTGDGEVRVFFDETTTLKIDLNRIGKKSKCTFMVNDTVTAIEFISTHKREDLTIKLEMVDDTKYVKNVPTLTITCLPHNLIMEDFTRPIIISSVAWKDVDITYFKGSFSDTCATELNVDTFSIDNGVLSKYKHEKKLQYKLPANKIAFKLFIMIDTNEKEAVKTSDLNKIVPSNTTYDMFVTYKLCETSCVFTNCVGAPPKHCKKITLLDDIKDNLNEEDRTITIDTSFAHAAHDGNNTIDLDLDKLHKHVDIIVNSSVFLDKINTTGGAWGGTLTILSTKRSLHDLSKINVNNLTVKCNNNEVTEYDAVFGTVENLMLVCKNGITFNNNDVLKCITNMAFDGKIIVTSQDIMSCSSRIKGADKSSTLTVELKIQESHQGQKYVVKFNNVNIETELKIAKLLNLIEADTLVIEAKENAPVVISSTSTKFVTIDMPHGYLKTSGHFYINYKPSVFDKIVPVDADADELHTNCENYNDILKEDRTYKKIYGLDGKPFTKV